MAKKRTTRPAKAAKGATVNTAPDTSIPPVYSMRPAGAPPDPKPDPARGALTEGMDIVPAFNELILEGKAAQYMLLDRARMGIQHHYPIIRDKERQRPSPALLLTERDGMLGYDPNRDRLPAERKKPDRYGATYHRATRTLKWTATIHRLATNEELANRVRDLGERRGATAQHLLDDTLKWCKTRQQDPNFMPTAEELRRYRVDMYGLPDKTDKELLKHYLNRPLPLWYTRGVSWDVYPATGPDDARYPVGTIDGAFVATDHKATDHEIWTRWFDEFAAEVEVCVERFKAHNELPDELARLIDNLRAFEIGQGEAAPFIADLLNTGAGKRIMDMMNDGKTRLLRRLEQVRDDAVPTSMNNGTSTTKGIVWNGTLQQLAWVLRELAEGGWIGYPAQKGNTTKWKAGDINASAFAKAMAPHFKEVKEKTLAQELKPGGGTVPAADVEGWEIPKRPE